MLLKRIRRGAYEFERYLVVRQPWLGEKWDGRNETFRRWAVYRAASPIEDRVLLSSFRRFGEACAFIRDEWKRRNGPNARR